MELKSPDSTELNKPSTDFYFRRPQYEEKQFILTPSFIEIIVLKDLTFPVH